jgi:hypothetical protein
VETASRNRGRSGDRVNGFGPIGVRCNLEKLEDRLAPATVSWNVDANGNWETASNWSAGYVPGPNDTVVIDRAVTVSMSSTDTVQRSCEDFEKLVRRGASNSFPT